MREKIIYCAPIFGYPAIGGPELKVINVLIALSQIAEVKLILWSKVQNDEFMQFASKNKIEVFYADRYSFKNLKLEPPFLSGKPLTAWRLLRHKLGREQVRDQKAIASSINLIAKSTDTNIVWFSYANYFSSEFLSLRAHARDLKLIADTDSVSSRYTLRGIPFVDNRKRIKLVIKGLKEKYREVQLVNHSDVLTAVSEIDLQYYASINHSKRIALAYNVLNTDDYILEKGISQEKYIIITGSFGHFDSPMDQGTRWFIEKVWPLVRNYQTGLKLRIVGKNSDKVWGNLKEADVEVFGWVPDTKPHLSGAAVCIVPLWFESGTRFKILESGILKTPVVTTSLGAEGLKVDDGVHVLIADSPELFAEQIVLAMNLEKSNMLVENLYAKVIDCYSTVSLQSQLLSAIQLVSSKH